MRWHHLRIDCSDAVVAGMEDDVEHDDDETTTLWYFHHQVQARHCYPLLQHLQLYDAVVVDAAGRYAWFSSTSV